MNIFQKISEINLKIERLDRDFNFYFTGREKKPPLTSMDSLKKEIDGFMRVIEDLKNSADKHVVSQLINRFAVYRQKWERGLRDIEEGRARQGLSFAFGPNLRRSPSDNFGAVEEQDATAFKINSIIEETANKFIKLSKDTTGKAYSKEAVSSMLEKQVVKVRQKFGDNFVFDVFCEGGKVKIRPKKAK